MKAVSARVTRGLNIGAVMIAADNSGAKITKLVSIKHGKSKKGRQGYAKVADWVKVSVRKGLPDMKGKVFDAIVVRQKKSIEDSQDIDKLVKGSAKREMLFKHLPKMFQDVLNGKRKEIF